MTNKRNSEQVSDKRASAELERTLGSAFPLPFVADRIELVRASELKQGNRALRRRSERGLQTLVDLICKFGFLVPLMVNEEGWVLAGVERLAAAKKLGMPAVPIIRVNHLSPAEQELFRIADNQLVNLSTWDEEALKESFEMIIDLNGSMELELTGFATAEIDNILDMDLVLGEEGADPDDEAAEPVSEPVSRVGDLWLLGKHRLLCGDATDAAAVERVLYQLIIRAVITDPPYNVPIANHVRGGNQHREFVQASGEMSQNEFATLLRSALALARDQAVDGALIYSFMDWRSIELLMRCGREEGLTLINLAVWAKQNAGLGSLYRSKHELCAVFKVGTAPHINNVMLGAQGRYRTNVWDYAGVSSFGHGREEALAAHPTVKPVAMIADIIKDVTKRGDCVFDSFAGSGTLLIAAQRTGRVACAMELDPIYVDTAIARFEKRFPIKATLAETGETLAQVRERRTEEALVTSSVGQTSQTAAEPEAGAAFVSSLRVRRRTRPQSPSCLGTQSGAQPLDPFREQPLATQSVRHRTRPTSSVKRAP